jgi:glycosyltransferase involved in cell wall biosynthesis
MAFAKSVVASRSAGTDETIDDGVHGWLYDRNDLGQLLERLQRAVSMTRDERHSMGARATERLKERHKPDALAETVERLLSGAPMLHDPCGGSTHASKAQF